MNEIEQARAEAYAAGLAEGRLQARQEIRQRMTQALLDMAAADRAVLLGNASGPGSLETAR
jgi:flagellar biosynthesis/type III secretory pathway protein FliH